MNGVVRRECGRQDVCLLLSEPRDSTQDVDKGPDSHTFPRSSYSSSQRGVSSLDSILLYKYLLGLAEEQ